MSFYEEDGEVVANMQLNFVLATAFRRKEALTTLSLRTTGRSHSPVPPIAERATFLEMDYYRMALVTVTTIVYPENVISRVMMTMKTLARVFAMIALIMKYVLNNVQLTRMRLTTLEEKNVKGVIPVFRHRVT